MAPQEPRAPTKGRISGAMLGPSLTLARANVNRRVRDARYFFLPDGSDC
jgi:hypothetical protein